MAFYPLLAESACLDPASLHSVTNQSVTNGVDTTLAQVLVVWIGAARIGVAVDAHAGGRILLHVGSDIGYLARLVGPNVRLIEIEQNVVERGPVLYPSSRGLGAYLSRGTLRAHRAGWAHWAGCTCHATGITAELAHGAVLIDAKIARFTRWIFQVHGVLDRV